jgi:thioredoxin reductase (NADPH)
MRTPEQIESIASASDRSAQRFPRLTDAQLATVKRFAHAEAKGFAASEPLYQVGDRVVPAWFILEGSVELTGRDGLDEQIDLMTLEAGQFTGELSQMGDRPALASVCAGAEGCLALPVDAARLRALIVGAAELGETIMRAFILRRVSLIERGVGPVLVGQAGCADLLRLQAFFTRSGYPHLVIESGSERGHEVISHLHLPPEDLPILICACGNILKRPSNEEAGAWLGITPTLNTDDVYDVAVVGSGPAGLATAVYAASEGLSVLVLDCEVMGGQAGASARIENYLGFPTGISGQALTGRALNQAQKFGAQVAIPVAAHRLVCEASADDPGFVHLTLSEQGAIRARAVVVASGARYRRPDIANLKQFAGDSVHYWASPVEAKLCTEEEVALIGAGNSAGQAVVFLAPHVKKLTMIVRGESLDASMSRYLIDRIAALDNVEVKVCSEVAQLHGGEGGALEAATVRDRKSGETWRLPLRHLFLFIGAEPNTDWLEGCLELDDKGYVMTGLSDPATAPLPLQTSMPRVFAIGDVRAGSTKRVASAVGEGAAVVAQIHAMLGAATTGA